MLPHPRYSVMNNSDPPYVSFDGSLPSDVHAFADLEIEELGGSLARAEAPVQDGGLQRCGFVHISWESCRVTPGVRAVRDLWDHSRLQWTGKGDKRLFLPVKRQFLEPPDNNQKRLWPRKRFYSGRFLARRTRKGSKTSLNRLLGGSPGFFWS